MLALMLLYFLIYTILINILVHFYNIPFQPDDQIFLKGYGFLSFAKNMGKIFVKI